MKKIAILASGSGTNAENIAKYFAETQSARVVSIGANKSDAFVLTRARNLGISSFVFNKTDLKDPSFLQRLDPDEIDLIVLAGFLLKIPQYLIDAFPDRIVNIHPALLPKYGGKGMYGDRVHKAVIDNQEVKSGITIHLVNEHYDEGRTLHQAECPVVPEDTPDSLASKVHTLEYEWFPKIIEEYLKEI